MKLFFDARYIRTDFHDGISRYATELGNALARQVEVTFIISDKAQLKFLPAGSKHVMLHPVTSWREPFSALWLNKFHPDVVATPLQTLGGFGRRFKMVLTVQDLTYYKHRTPPAQYNFLIRAVWRLFHLTYVPERIILKGADIVATISNTVKQEISDAHLTKKPIVVVPNAARDLSGYVKNRLHVTRQPKNLIYMGAFTPYKNAETLIQSLAYITPRRTLHLLSPIKPSRKAELEKLIPEGAKVVFHDGVTDEDYAYLLADDAIMVSASRAEGFGLPLIEAQMMGVACVVSDIDIFHEVGGDGALYADPDSPQDFAAKIASLDDKKIRDELITKGKKQASSYSWNNSAKSLLIAINKI